MSNRNEILRAVSEASRVSNNHPINSRTSFDLISVYQSLDIPVVFRPLDVLWGAVISIGEKRGVIVHAKLPRHLQRFTLAHELGHILLEHDTQFDEEVGLNRRATGSGERPIQERAANRFASELLAPQPLIRENAERLGLSKDQLREPENIYQLSLRLGLSFKATCWALFENNLLDHGLANKLTNKNGIVKEAKSSFIPDSVTRNARADVWQLGKRETGLLLEASEEDTYLIELEENSSSGFIWEFEDSNPNVEIVLDTVEMGEEYGAGSSRTIGFRFPSLGTHTISVNHLRPWSDEVDDKLEFKIDNFGRESVGFPRKTKQMSLREAVT